MSQIISKKHNGREIAIGEISVKQSNIKNELVTVFKVYHQGPHSEEDLFMFRYNKHMKDWVLDLEMSLVSLTKKTNYRLIKEVYSNFKSSDHLSIQKFTDLLLEKYFDIFIESNRKAFKCRFTFREFLKRMFGFRA